MLLVRGSSSSGVGGGSYRVLLSSNNLHSFRSLKSSASTSASSSLSARLALTSTTIRSDQPQPRPFTQRSHICTFAGDRTAAQTTETAALQRTQYPASHTGASAPAPYSSRQFLYSSHAASRLPSLASPSLSTVSLLLRASGAARHFSTSTALGGPRITYDPSHFVRKRRHGYLSRIRTRTGRAILRRRRQKGRRNLSH